MENENDRSGEDSYFGARANEDSYFAVKEHDLIEGLKTEFRKGETDRREAAMASCPKCSGKFKVYGFMGIDIERCENCEGIWLQKGKLAGILRQQARGPLGIFLDRYFSKGETGKRK